MTIGSNPSGYKSKLSIAKESAYGVIPSVDFHRFLFTRHDLDSEQSLDNNPTLGQGRDPLKPIQNVIDVRGQIGFVLDPRRIGFVLAGLFGSPTSTDETTHWEHVFKSGSLTLPSYSFEVDYGIADKFKMVSGVGIDAIDINFERTGFATATIDVIGQKDVVNSTTQSGTVQEFVENPFSNFKLDIKRDGVSLGSVVSAAMRYANNLSGQEHIRNDGYIDGLDLSQGTCSGNLTMRFDDTTMMDLATNGTPVSLEFVYKISDTLQLIFSIHEVYLPKVKAAIDGPGGIQVSFPWEASHNEAEGCMLSVTLVNDIDDMVY